jgi:hypothetical protein
MFEAVERLKKGRRRQKDVESSSVGDVLEKDGGWDEFSAFR